MANTPMPVGIPKYFKGDIRVINPDAFGYFYCEITSPVDIAHPILQRRIKTSEGIRTIAGTGSWTGWVYSEEMYNAQNNHKYQFKILKGYEFDKGYIFKDYIDTLYALRMQFDKEDPMNYVAKLLMNSLYGKFGMKTQSTKVDIYNILNEAELKVFNEMVDTEGPAIQDWFKLDQHYVVIRDNISNYYTNEDNDHYHGLDVNVAIAAAITAGGRMWMSTIKNSLLFNLFYSDTDSFVTNKPLPSFMVGSGLGQFKLEYTIKRAVFLAPKVYAFITSSGEEIIKVKGIKQDALSGLHIEHLENLLHKDSTKEFTQDKWFKKIFSGDITITDVAYTLKATSNKREIIYRDGIYENTKPYNYNDLINK
jgi:DNA polymerase type B, organellar and viral